MARWGLIAALCAVSLQVQALRTGDIRTESRLNEPLRATLPVMDLTPLEARSLEIRVAENDIYARLGLERAAAVSDLRFELDGSGPNAVIRVFGQRPLSDPYVILLLDLRTSAGRLLREYTILLDPAEAVTPPVADPTPALAQAPASATSPAPVAAPRATPAAAPQGSIPLESAAQAPEPVAQPLGQPPAEPFRGGAQERRTAVPPPMVDGRTAPATATPASRGVVLGNQPVVGREAADPAPAASAAAASEYGPVRSGETLFSIAAALRPAADVTAAQVAWALFSANPQAFDGSPDLIQRGAVLSVPDAAQMRSQTTAQARALLRGGTGTAQFVRAPETPRAATPAATPTRVAATPRPVITPAPTRAPVAADAFDAAPDAFDSAPDAFADAADAFAEDDEFGAEVPSTEPQSTPVVSAAERAATSGSGSGLPAWLWPVLGGVLVAIVVLIALARRKKSAATQAPMAVASTGDGVGRARKAQDPFSSTSTMSAAGMGAAGAAALAHADADDDDVVSLDAAPLADSSDTADAKTQRFATAKPAPAARDSADEDPTLAFDAVGDSTPTMAFDAVDDVEQESGDSPFDADATQAMSAADSDQTVALEPERTTSAKRPAEDSAQPKSASSDDDDVFTLDAAADAADDSFGSETISIDISGSDPLAEADFNLAYGLYDEAALTLNAALEAEPERIDLLEKLAEVHFAAGDSDQFTQVAKRVQSLAPDSSAWSNVALLGSQMLPDSPLFAGANADDAVMDLDFGDQLEDTGTTATDADDGRTVAFSLDDVEPEAAPEPTPAPSADDKERLVEFSLDAEEDAPAAAAESPAAAPAAEIDETALSLDDDAADEDRSDELQSMDMDLGDFDLDASVEDLEFPSDPAATGGDEGGLELSDLEMEGLDADAEEALDLSDGTIDLGDETLAELDTSSTDDDLGTLHLEPGDDETVDLGGLEDDAVSTGDDLAGKLDLARGYIDMSELDMARSLLDEVVARGDPDQQAEAQAMLDRLS